LITVFDSGNSELDSGLSYLTQAWAI